MFCLSDATVVVDNCNTVTSNMNPCSAAKLNGFAHSHGCDTKRLTTGGFLIKDYNATCSSSYCNTATATWWDTSVTPNRRLTRKECCGTHRDCSNVACPTVMPLKCRDKYTNIQCEVNPCGTKCDLYYFAIVGTDVFDITKECTNSSTTSSSSSGGSTSLGSILATFS